MISLQKKFLFIHIPKTAGNSIQGILKEFSEDRITSSAEVQDGIERFGVENSFYKTRKHSSLALYKKVIEQDTWNKLYKFATIRNPWDKMISFYFSPHAGRSDWNRDEFLKFIKKVRPLEYFVCEMSLRDKIQAKFNIYTNGKKIENIDLFMRFEHLQEDFDKVCQVLDIPHYELPKRNSSKREHYSKYYDDELVELVRKKHRREIELGDYTFERVAK